jgi:hypothetical protein
MKTAKKKHRDQLEPFYRKRDRAVARFIDVCEKCKKGEDKDDEFNQALDALALAQVALTFSMMG